MTDFRLPPTGSEVEITFKGTVSDTAQDEDCGGNDHFEVFFEDGRSVSWYVNEPAPEIKIVDPGWKVGDVAWYTRPDGGGRKTVMYGYSESRDQLPHWRDAQGTIIRIADGTENRIEIIARSSTK